MKVSKSRMRQLIRKQILKEFKENDLDFKDKIKKSLSPDPESVIDIYCIKVHVHKFRFGEKPDEKFYFYTSKESDLDRIFNAVIEYNIGTFTDYPMITPLFDHSTLPVSSRGYQGDINDIRMEKIILDKFRGMNASAVRVHDKSSTDSIGHYAGNVIYMRSGERIITMRY